VVNLPPFLLLGCEKKLIFIIVGSDENILTMKISRSTVFIMSIYWSVLYFLMWCTVKEREQMVKSEDKELAV